MEERLRDRFSVIEDLTGVDLNSAIVSIKDCDVPGVDILITWGSFYNMKYAEIVDFCISKMTNSVVQHTFEAKKCL